MGVRTPISSSREITSGWNTVGRQTVRRPGNERDSRDGLDTYIQIASASGNACVRVCVCACVRVGVLYARVEIGAGGCAKAER